VSQDQESIVRVKQTQASKMMLKITALAALVVLAQKANSNPTAPELPYELLGCFKDSIPRALTSLEGKQNLKTILTDYYTRRTDAVKKCYEATKKLGNPFFAVQDGGQCFSSQTAEVSYSKYGSSSDCGSDGEGGPMANSVYKIKTA
jgi:hypothetical protein